MVIRVMPARSGPLRAEEAAEMWTKAGPAVVGAALMLSVLAFIHHAFAGIVAPALLGGWLGYMGGVVATLLIMLLAFRVPGLRARGSSRFWVGATQTIGIALTTGIAASVWILLPHAGDTLRMLMILLYLWFVAVVMMASGSRLAMVGSLGAIASLALFVVTHDMPYASALIGFLGMAGIGFAMIRGLIWRAADQAADARAMSERAAEQLRLALAIASGERDAKTRFIAAATHDLQQPLHAASLYFDQTLEGRDPEGRTRAANGVRRALGSTQALLATMLEFLRLEADAMPVRRETVAISALIAELALEHGAAAQAAGMRIMVAPSRLTTIADPHLLQRALGNVIANAVRHAAGTRITIGARRHGVGMRLWVIDNGRGIGPADLPTLFDDFTQGSGDSDTARGGFGIGLASARRMVALMGGTIGVVMRRRGGSAFWIDLPTAATAVAAMTETARCEAA